MDQNCEKIRALMSGSLDGELGPEDEALLEAHVAACEDCEKEFEEMKLLVRAASGLSVKPPPEEVWDTFLDNVYNRTERKTGWVVLVVGIVGLTCAGVYYFITVPWPSPLIKSGAAIVLAGLMVLFISVFRQRRFVAKTDRYSRDVKR